MALHISEEAQQGHLLEEYNGFKLYDTLHLVDLNTDYYKGAIVRITAYNQELNAGNGVVVYKPKFETTKEIATKDALRTVREWVDEYNNTYNPNNMLSITLSPNDMFLLFNAVHAGKDEDVFEHELEHVKEDLIAKLRNALRSKR